MVCPTNLTLRMQTKKIILLADQPHQAKVMAELANEIHKLNSSIKISLAFTDYYTFYFQKNFLNELISDFNGEVLTQEDMYKSWQDPRGSVDIDDSYLENWSKSYCKDRSLDQLLRTNQWVYGDEHDRFLLKTSKKWKTKILFDSILWCEKLISEQSPSLIVSLGNETMPTNILFEISKEQKIPFFTIIHSRIKNYWIMRMDFAYGMGSYELQKINDKYSSKDVISLAENFILDLVTENQSFYSSGAHKIVDTFRKKKESILKNLVQDLKKFVKHSYWRAFILRRERPYRVKRVEQNLTKVSYDQFRHLVINYFRLLGFDFCGIRHVPDSNFFLWALHARPEASVVVLGQGQDEIEKLIETADKIPNGYFLAVKENPIMLGRRKRGFYRKLKRHKKIILVDPAVSSYELIKKSIGIIGISGTILLEAAFFDKPSCSLGKPEFEDFLIENGFENIETFLNRAISKTHTSAREKVTPYVAYILSEAKNGNLSYYAGIDNSASRDAIRDFACDLHAYMSSKSI